MIKRRLEASLVEWYKDPVHKPLILRGARQVGKTSVVRKFGQEYFTSVIEINLESLEERKVFEGVESVVDLERRLELARGEKMEKGKLLFVDEVQELEEMMRLLRFVAEEKPDWHVIVTGSLLEAKMGGKWNVPVGRVEYRFLFPLTFFEFLGAMGQDSLLTDLRTVKLGEHYKYHDVARKAFEQYLLLGGMPEVVADFRQRRDYRRVKKILMRLFRGYVDDIEKYATSGLEKKYLETVVVNGAKLAGKRYRYENFAGSQWRSREMSEAIVRVEKTMLCTQISAINSVQLPLNIKPKRAKKMLWLDVGFVNLVNEHYGEMVRGEYAGSVMEQVVGQTLVSQLAEGLSQLTYFAKDKSEGSAEVDFAFSCKGKLVMMEVKAGKSTSSRSLTGAAKLGGGRVVPIVVGWGELTRKSGITKIPFYLLERWEELTVV